MIVYIFISAKFGAFARAAAITFPLSLLGVLSLLPAAPARADVGVGVNGGILADASAYHVEFIGGAAYALMIFAVSDHRQKPVPAREISGYAIVAQNGQATRLRLLPEGDNLLAAVPVSPLLAGTTVFVVAKLASGETLKARFVSP